MNVSVKYALMPVIVICVSAFGWQRQRTTEQGQK